MRDRDYDVLSYTDEERVMVIISYGFESYHPQCTVFWFTSYIWFGSCSHLQRTELWCTWKRTETRVFRWYRVRLFLPHQSSNELSHHSKRTGLFYEGPLGTLFRITMHTHVLFLSHTHMKPNPFTYFTENHTHTREMLLNTQLKHSHTNN